jgi:hypothetical protein
VATFDPTKLYAYIDLDLVIDDVHGDELHDKGNWSSGGVYNRYDVVAYQTALYIALRSVTTYPPTAIVDENWSSLVDITEQGTTDLTLEQLYNLILSTGTTANTALQTAWYGTNLAYTALITAWYGTSSAYTALTTAWVGTNTANSALAAASAGTDLALTAYNIAIAGTNLAYTALQQAWYGTEVAALVAYPALVTSWVGTNTANSALAAASAGTDLALTAYHIAITGTNQAAAGIDLANQALVLAQTGTVPPFLDELQDVNASAPTSSQVLMWDGAQWMAGDAPSTTAPSAFSYYLDDASSGTGGYATLLTQPSGTLEDADVLVVSAASSPAYLEGYLSTALNRTLLDAGLWEFNTYASVSAATGTVITDIYTHSLSGAETFLFSGTSSPVTSTTPQLVTNLLAEPLFAASPSDKLLARYWFTTESVAPVTMTMYHNGTSHYSHFHTPLRTEHNDLAGLQGGQTGERYHLTADQNAAAEGTEGLPSASNKFVTNADSRLATGVDAYYISISGTAQAQDAHDLAQLAYDLASVNPAQPDVGNWLLSGGNVIWTSGYTFAVPPTVVSFNGTAVSFVGTNVTLEPADSVDDRIDLVVADNIYGTIAVITGTPSTPPATPEYDPVSQFELTFVPVDDNTTQPTGVDTQWIYLENTEWILTSTHATINVNSTNNPYAGTKDIEATNSPINAAVRYAAPLTFSLGSYSTLFFWIAPKPNWGTRYLRIQFETTSGLAGQPVALQNGVFGFNEANPGYQLVSIPTHLFAVPSATNVFRIRFTVVSTSGSMSGFYLDNIGLQLGVSAPATPIPDASTTTKGIVQLEINGGTVPGRAVTGDDYRMALGAAGTNLAYTALQQAWYGTQAAADIGYPALVTAWVGTATANVALRVGADGTNGVNWEGTNRISADQMLQSQIDSLRISVGTMPTSLMSSGTLYYDFAGSTYQRTTVDTNMRISTINMAAGREIAIVLEATGPAYTLGFPGTYSWYGLATPPSSISTKNHLFAMACLDDSLSGVMAAVSTKQ